MTNTSAQQRISLRGVQNFREIAGYRTRDGQRLKRNRLWRSATLHNLSTTECEAIIANGIKTIVDLRGVDERVEKPTPTVLTDRANVLTWTTQGMPAASRSFRERLLQSKDEEQIRAMVVSFYRKIADDHAVQLRETYRSIADGNTPMLIHCAAGKDRTGIAVALLLDLLGIEREQIFQDYELSERLLDWDQMSFTAALGLHDDPDSDQAIPLHLLRPLMRSDRAYLDAALCDIEARYGSTEAFYRERLKLTPATIDLLRTELLEN